MRFKIGTSVKTPLGNGKIACYDLFYSKNWRYGVKMEEPILICGKKKDVLCFFPSEIEQK